MITVIVLGLYSMCGQVCGDCLFTDDSVCGMALFKKNTTELWRLLSSFQEEHFYSVGLQLCSAADVRKFSHMPNLPLKTCTQS